MPCAVEPSPLNVRHTASPPSKRSAYMTPAATGIVPASIEVEWMIRLLRLPIWDQLSLARPGESTLPHTWAQTSSILIPSRSDRRQSNLQSFKKNAGMSRWMGEIQSVGFKPNSDPTRIASWLWDRIDAF